MYIPIIAKDIINKLTSIRGLQRDFHDRICQANSEVPSGARETYQTFVWLGHHLLSDDATQMIQIGVLQGLIKRLLDPSANKGLLSSYCQFLPVLFPLFLFGVGRGVD